MRRQGLWGYLFTAPYVIHILVFMLFPFLFSLYLTFTTWDFFNPPKWIGLRNWTELFANQPFWLALRNISYFALLFVPLQTVLALVVAYLLNQNIRGKAIFRVLYFLPAITPWVAAGLIWLWLFNNEAGIANWLLRSLHIGTVNWLNSGRWWVVIGSVALVNVWKGAGSSMVMLLAGMQNISKEMMESARIDGAGGWSLFSKIVAPIVSPMIYLVLILATISAFHTFDVFLVMFDYNAIPDRTNIPNLIVYQDAFLHFKAGRASTMAWVMFVIIMAITLFQKQFEKRWVHYE